MKNIHLIPTDKPSRLYQLKNDILRLDYKLDRCEANKHIYITNSEEIKEGDWVYCIVNDIVLTNGKKTSRVCKATKKNIDWSKKIILTTDQDLIKDGVQAIDDEFLEWFVKNPSCEEIEVKRGYLGMGGFVETNELLSKDKMEYKIIIPKEETTKKCYHINTDTEYLGSEETKKEAVKKGWAFYKKEELKQETLEEVAGNLADPNICKTDNWIEGAKWQAERMYSEEDLKEAFESGGKMSWTDINQEEKEPYYYDFNNWFTQFKK